MNALENPVWSALTSEHAGMARGNGLARRYPSDVSPFSGLREPTAAALADLAPLVGPGEDVGILTLGELALPAGWTRRFVIGIEQMVYDGPPVDAPETESLTLGALDAPEMLALATLTEPGPFAARTHTMGHYIGLRAEDGQLIAMAGERMRLSGATEISAVCTHPDFQGRGHGRAMMAAMLARILAQGRLPFLHVKTGNPALQLYERLGFRVSRVFRFTRMTQDASSGPNDSSVG